MRLCTAFLAALLWLAPAAAQQPQIQREGSVTTQPDAHVKTSAVYEATAITYPYDVSGHVDLRPTDRIPDADGRVRVQRKAGATKLELKVDDMKPATLFGGDYNTYVFWAISPQGQAQNLGEVILDGDSGKLETSTKLDTFAMLVTAEPHYLVTTPSPFVVLKNTADVPGIKTAGQPFTIHYGYPVTYRYERETLAGLSEVSGKVRTGVNQAYTAVRLAERAGAAQFAQQDLDQARQALQKAVSMSSQKADQRDIESQAHEAVRLAVAAQTAAEKGAEQARLEAERNAYQQQMAMLESRIRQAATEADRARLEAERQQLQLKMEEQAREQAQLQAREASEQLKAAREQTQQLQQSEAQALARAEEAEQQAEQARQQQQQTMTKMQNALNQIAETRATARGLIVNIPDVLFDFDKSTLRPEGRERLSKIAGIVLGSGAQWNFAVEGHTDNIGTETYNQRLSDQRAQTVANYLEAQGVPRSSIVEVQGLGEAQPIASNDTAEGRQRNRRVEIIIQQPEQPISE